MVWYDMKLKSVEVCSVKHIEMSVARRGVVARYAGRAAVFCRLKVADWIGPDHVYPVVMLGGIQPGAGLAG